MTNPDSARWYEHEPERFGPMSGWAWRNDPRHVLFTLARYKFVAKMLEGRDRVLEIGCADAFGTRLVAQGIRWGVTAIDTDEDMLKAGREQAWAAEPPWPKITLFKHDILQTPIEGYDAAYAIDVLEHVPSGSSYLFLKHLAQSVTPDGVAIIGTTSLESQLYASEPSKEGHVNCQTMASLKSLASHHFKTVFMFGQNDEVIHTGFGAMCHYLWAVCVTPRTYSRDR